MSSTLLSIELCRNYIEENLFGQLIENNFNQENKAGRIGVELECFPYTINTQKEMLPANLYGEGKCLSDTLLHLSEKKDGKVRYFDPESTHEQHKPVIAAIDFTDGSCFQFEPGAQVEMSTSPCYSIELVSEQIKFMQQILLEISDQTDYRFVQSGTNPWFSVDEIRMQMDKTRYRAMSNYFDSLNKFGRQMMLQTSSIQVNMDAGTDWTTRTKRFVAANLLAPFAIALFANSPVTAGKVNGYKSHRSYIWQHLDYTRTGILNMDELFNHPEKEKLIDVYLRFALKAPVLFIQDFGDEIFPANFTMEYWLTHPAKGLLPTLEHFKNHLSLLFPEVRLKGYLEIRSVDTPPPEWQMIPVIFYSSLLYSNSSLDKTLDLLLPLSLQLPRLMEQSAFGLEEDDVFTTAKKLITLAMEGLSDLPESFRGQKAVEQVISFSECFTMQRKTFADDFLKKFQP